MTKRNRVLIIDALNMYFRAYIVDPSLSSNGQPIGGMKGFLKIFQKTIRETKPDRIIIAWDGAGGSRKRKTINKGYKEGRKPIRLNRDIRNLSENEEIENKVWQQTRLVQYLNNMPISQIMLPEIEADDVIAYVTQMPSLREWDKVIVSNDKDFFQLCDDRTILVRPTQKVVLNESRIVEEYGIHPLNFAMARAIAGDKSDNLPGVPGVGLPTIAKRLPFLAEGRSVFIEEILEFCENTENKLKVHSNILECEAAILENYQIMQLYAPMMSPQAKRSVRFAIDSAEHEFNKTEVIKMMAEDGFGDFSWTDLFSRMRKIVVDNVS